jgi:hypothetical protein
MYSIFFFPLVILSFVSASTGYSADGDQLDLSGVTMIRISGDESAIAVTTSSSEPYRATLGGTRRGWFSGWSSSWFGDYCPVGGTMHVDKDTVYIEAATSSRFGFSNCTPRIDLNVASGADISIDQPAAKIRLDGHFSTITLTTHAADFSLDGHADNVDLTANAMRSNLAYDSVEKTESIKIDANSLDATIDFGGRTPLDYRVDGKAVLVDSKEPSVAGAKPEIRIRGDFVRATLR